jgi:K+-transporting ATPase ATPase C chain
MVSHLRPAIMLVVLFTVLCGLALPLGITGLAGLVVPVQAGGSLVLRDGQPVGSSLIGQSFARPDYFQTRPSATSAPDPKDSSKTVPLPYNAANSSASNLAPTAKALIDRVKAQIGTATAPEGGYAQDQVTSSASGLDPDISPENAAQQVARVAAARKIDPAKLQALIDEHRQPALLGLFGGPRVNVLELNLALDRMK